MKRFHWTLGILSIYIISCNNNGNVDKPAADSGAATGKDTAVASAARVPARKKLHICTEMSPPPPPFMKMKAVTDTFYHFEFNRVDTLKVTDVKPTHIYLAALVGQYKWRTDTVHVAFLDGDPEVIKRVQAIARQWEDYAGIVFDFNPSYQGKDITISFLYNGSWSQIGTYSRKVKPSMNFGWLDRDSSPEEYQRVVLHEFGHALGFIHEQSQPDAQIPWNRPAVYQYYRELPNEWDSATVDRNIFFKYDRAQINGTRYDTNSIMHYYIPAELTDGVFHVDEKDRLSDLDKQFAAKWYPKKKKIKNTGH